MKIQKDVLVLWQAQHGKLKLPLMSAFLEREETSRIGLYPKPWIKNAFNHTQKLDEALVILRWRSALDFNSERAHSRQLEASNSAQDPLDITLSEPTKDVVSQEIQPAIRVVGESFYRENFEFVRKLLGAPGKSRHRATFLLVRDPSNPFSKSGKAIRVLFGNLTLGFVPEVVAPAVFSMVERLERKAYVAGTIWFDSAKAHQPRNSVRIYCVGSYEESKKLTPHNSALKNRSNVSQADQDAATWQENHPNSKPQEPVWYDSTRGKIAPVQKHARKPKAPFKMHFYCQKCHMNAGSRSRPCVSCGTLMRLPRPAAKSLAVSKGRWQEDKAKRKLQRLEQLREQAKRDNFRS